MQRHSSLIFVLCAVGIAACRPVTMEETEDLPATLAVYDSLELQTVMSLPTPDDANPEIVRMIPGTNDKAVFVSSEKKSITLIDYTASGFSFGTSYFYFQDNNTANLTSIDVSPAGDLIAITIARTDCSKGSLLLVTLADGVVQKTLEVGYNPDSAAFSKNGLHVVVANEDDREDRPCKPASRKGGSITFIDLSSGASNASVTQEIPIDHDDDSEPEGIKISPDNNTVLIAVQETSEVGFASLADLPNASFEFVALPKFGDNSAQPDGLAVSDDGLLGMAGNENNGTFTLINMETRTLYGTYGVENDATIVARSGGNYLQSPPFNIDERKATKRTEPEECRLITMSGKTYAVVVLQESHAVMAFDVTDPTAPVFDSIAATGIDAATDIDKGQSSVGSEGLAFNTTNGVIFVANERENSITMLKSSWTDDTF